MFAFLYVAFCPACLVWGIVSLLALGAFVTLFFWWLFGCRPTRCRVFQELLFLMIHVDLVEVLQMVLGNCIITSNPAFAGSWALILTVFTTLAYWGTRAYCPSDNN